MQPGWQVSGIVGWLLFFGESLYTATRPPSCSREVRYECGPACDTQKLEQGQEKLAKQQEELRKRVDTSIWEQQLIGALVPVLLFVWSALKWIGSALHTGFSYGCGSSARRGRRRRPARSPEDGESSSSGDNVRAARSRARAPC